MYVTDLAKAVIFELFITSLALHLNGSSLYVVLVVTGSNPLAYLKQVLLIVLKFLVVKCLGTYGSPNHFVILDVVGSVMWVHPNLVLINGGCLRLVLWDMRFFLTLI